MKQERNQPFLYKWWRGEAEAAEPSVRSHHPSRASVMRGRVVLVIGEQKCGTTYLDKLLRQMPEALACRTKEQHFFDRLAFLSRCELEAYLACYPSRTSPEQLMLDVTPDYLARPWAAPFAARVLPQAQLVVLVRDPIARALAAWKMQRRLGHERRSFSTAIREELHMLRDCPALGQALLDADGATAWVLAERNYTRTCAVGYCFWGSAIPGKPTTCQLLIYKGLYALHIQMWLRFFDPKRMLVVQSEKFFQQPATVLPALQAFLRTKHSFVPSNKSCLHATAVCGTDVKSGGTNLLQQELKDKLVNFYRASQMKLRDMCGSFLRCAGVA